MENNKEISKENILKVLEFFTKKIEDTELDFNTISDIDYYWDIVENKKLYNPSITPNEDLSLWQISEDWEYLNDLINGKREFIWYDFKYLSVIIRLLDKVYSDTE